MIIGLLGLLGICLGSFVNALVWRLHEQDELKEKKPKDIKKRLNEISISRGRSMCPHCRHQLHAKDLVPVLSWLSVGGKCRYCRKPISAQYPIVELATGALFALSYVLWPYDLHNTFDIAAFATWLGILTGLIAHSIYDLRWFTLLDKITWPLTALGVLFVGLLAAAEGSMGIVAGPIIGAVTIFGLFFALFQISSGKWIGGGDVKLAPLLGLLAGGLLESMLLLFVASTLGTLFAVAEAVVRKKKLHGTTRIPFGPFLIAAAVIVVLFGSDIVTWYTDLLIVP